MEDHDDIIPLYSPFTPQTPLLIKRVFWEVALRPQAAMEEALGSSASLAFLPFLP